jgi:hypothetical protein
MPSISYSTISGDPIRIKPVYSTDIARAWKLDPARAQKRMKVPANHDGTVAIWIVEAPWAHPLWHSYGLVVVHLRPHPCCPEPKIYLEGATHEVWLYALDPNKPRHLMINRCDMKFLLPLNFAAQIIEETDEKAAERLEKAVKEILDGKLIPDTDYISMWVARFGDNMIRRKMGVPPVQEGETVH